MSFSAKPIAETGEITPFVKPKPDDTTMSQSEIDILSQGNKEKLLYLSRRIDKLAKAISHLAELRFESESSTSIHYSKGIMKLLWGKYWDEKMYDPSKRIAEAAKANDFAAVEMKALDDDIDIEMQEMMDAMGILMASSKEYNNENQQGGLSRYSGKLAHTALAVAAQVGVVAVSLAVTDNNLSDESKVLLRSSVGFTVVGFNGSLGAILFHRKKKVVAPVFQGIGCAGTVLGFMLMMGLILV